MTIEPGSSIGLTLSCHVPRPIAEPYKTVFSEQGTAAARYGRRIPFLENSLRFLIGVMDAERLALGLDAAGEFAALRKRLGKTTLGQLRVAAVDLARSLAGRPALVAPEIPALFFDADGRRTALVASLEAITAVRNDRTHDGNLVLPTEAEARLLLQRLRPHFTAWLTALCALRSTPLLIIEGRETRMDGRSVSKLLAFRGTDTQVLRDVFDVSPELPERIPFIVNARGDALLLAPWVVAGTFGQSGSLHPRVFERWRDGAPMFARQDHGDAARWLARRDEARDVEDFFAHYQVRTRHDGAVPVSLVERIMAPSGASAVPVVPGYRVIEVLGQGASSTVYLGRREGGGGDVALKVLHPAVVGEERQRLRLQREWSALRRVSAPGVARVIDLIETPESGPVLVMQRVRGESLSHRIAQDPLGPDAAARLCCSLLESLEVVHGQGLVHRDVKPSNVLLDAQERPVLVDFGVALVDDQARITRTGDAVGTLGFMAPEQREGQSTDPRVDLYAVGRLLPAIVRPGAPFSEQLAALPPGLQAVVRRATQEDPQARYPDARTMRLDIEERRRAGWGGAPVGVGDLLLGNIRLVAELGEQRDGIYLFEGLLIENDVRVGVLVASRAEEAGRALKLAIQGLKSTELTRLGSPTVQRTADGLRFCVLHVVDLEAGARSLLGIPEPSSGDGTAEAVVAGAAVVGAVLGAGALLAGALGLANVSAAARKRRAKVRQPGRVKGGAAEQGPSKVEVVAKAHKLGMLIHGFAHSTGERGLSVSSWRGLDERPLLGALMLFHDTGWSGPVGGLLARLSQEERSGALRGLQHVQGLARGKALPPTARADVLMAFTVLKRLVKLAAPLAARDHLEPFVRGSRSGDWFVMRLESGKKRYEKV